MKRRLNKLLMQIIPFFGLGIFVVLLAVGLVIFSYLLVIGAAVGVILFTFFWIYQWITQRRTKKFLNKQQPTQGRTIDHEPK